MGKRSLTALAVHMLISFFILAQLLSGQTKTEAKPAPKPLKLNVGDTAPDFNLLAFDGAQVKKIALHDYRGKKNVALAFYVFAFTGG